MAHARNQMLICPILCLQLSDNTVSLSLLNGCFKGRLYWELVTFLLTPNSNCITSVEDIGLQLTPLSWSVYGIIREFIPWPSDIVGIQAIWPPYMWPQTVSVSKIGAWKGWGKRIFGRWTIDTCTIWKIRGAGGGRCRSTKNEHCQWLRKYKNSNVC